MTEHSDIGEAEATHRLVDLAPQVHEPTEPDEAAVLEGLYGEPDDDGIYRGEAR
ncbi:hypothetical protein GCM10010182_67760 [Actinomadura cremea]|nr:hypothetical protein GCM10010182_67760 [Actinomadura cremea]